MALPKVVVAGQAPIVSAPGGVWTALAITSRDTDNVLSVSEYHCQPGDGPPLHRHTHEDETFWVLEGEIAFYVGEPGAGQVVVARPGTCVFGPRGTPHTFKNRSSSGARMLLIVTPPGNFEGFYARVMGQGRDGGMLDMGEFQRRIMAASAEHGLEILGPNPL